MGHARHRPSQAPTDGTAPSQAERVRWLRATSLLLSVLGLLVAGFLTYEHFTANTTLACPDTGAINCAKVTTSNYSQLLGAPVALLGLVYFVVMTVLCSPGLWRSTTRWLPKIRLAAASIGVAFVLYLVWAELFRINGICLWCTVVHVVTVALFGVLVFDAALDPGPKRRDGGRAKGDY